MQGMSDRANEATSASSRWLQFFPPASAGASDAEVLAPLSADQIGIATIFAIFVVVVIETLWLACLFWLVM